MTTSKMPTTPTPGVLFVASRIHQQDENSPNRLTPGKLCDWYENIHIQQVVALSGIPSAARYEAIPIPSPPSTHPEPLASNPPNPNPPNPSPPSATPTPKYNARDEPFSNQAPWLTVYEMPDLDFRTSKEFRGLDGQSEPEGGLLEGIFRRARFDTRFYERVQIFEGEGGKGGVKEGPAPFLLTAALSPSPSSSDFNAWYESEHLLLLSRIPGFRRTRRYKVVNATVLDQFVRKEPEVPVYLAMHEFDGEVLPIEKIKETAETEWGRRIMGGVGLSEVGWWRLKRGYGGWEGIA